MSPLINFYCLILLATASNPTKTPKVLCSCGKNSKDGQESCVQTIVGRTRCPCVTTGISCSRDCRCKGCQNKEEQELKKITCSSVSCRCGVDKSKTDPKYIACVDGKRKTKCPYVRLKGKCGSQCSCRNCGNCDRNS